MNERDETRLRDMLDAARKAVRFLEGKMRENLFSDDLLAFAVIRAIEITGEAASRVTSETREQNPQIQWKAIIGMRNRIIHDYLNVNLDIVWETVTRRIPELIEELEKIIPPESD